MPTSVCPYRRQCPPYFTVGVDVFIIGNSVSHNVYIFNTSLHNATMLSASLDPICHVSNAYVVLISALYENVCLISKVKKLSL